MHPGWFGGVAGAVSAAVVAGGLALVSAPSLTHDSVPAADHPQVLGRPAGAPRALIAKYGFNGRKTATTDLSGRGHTLRVISGHGGKVRLVPHGPGLALLFPARCVRRVCPHVALQTRSRPDLNPGARHFSYGADVLLSPAQTSKGQNVVQKGYSTASSQWKLQVDGAAGRPSCVLVGDRRRRIRMATSSVTVADGRWHRVRCSRVGTVLSVHVDDRLRGRTAVPRDLSVTNNHPMSIGGKGAYADNDQFNGILDNVWVQVG